MFSSQRLDWQTPLATYELLDKEFAFDFDPCPPDPSFDGLSIEWGQRNFVNPPYGREIGKWTKKAFTVSTAPVVVSAPSTATRRTNDDNAKMPSVWMGPDGEDKQRERIGVLRLYPVAAVHLHPAYP